MYYKYDSIIMILNDESDIFVVIFFLDARFIS